MLPHISNFRRHRGRRSSSISSSHSHIPSTEPGTEDESSCHFSGTGWSGSYLSTRSSFLDDRAPVDLPPSPDRAIILSRIEAIMEEVRAIATTLGIRASQSDMTATNGAANSTSPTASHDITVTEPSHTTADDARQPGACGEEVLQANSLAPNEEAAECRTDGRATMNKRGSEAVDGTLGQQTSNAGRRAWGPNMQAALNRRRANAQQSTPTLPAATVQAAEECFQGVLDSRSSSPPSMDGDIIPERTSRSPIVDSSQELPSLNELLRSIGSNGNGRYVNTNSSYPSKPLRRGQTPSKTGNTGEDIENGTPPPSGVVLCETYNPHPEQPSGAAVIGRHERREESMRRVPLVPVKHTIPPALLRKEKRRQQVRLAHEQQTQLRRADFPESSDTPKGSSQDSHPTKRRRLYLCSHCGHNRCECDYSSADEPEEVQQARSRRRARRLHRWRVRFFVKEHILLSPEAVKLRHKRAKLEVEALELLMSKSTKQKEEFLRRYGDADDNVIARR